MNTVPKFALCSLIAIALSACGQKGPLVKPAAKEPKPAATPANSPGTSTPSASADPPTQSPVQ